MDLSKLALIALRVVAQIPVFVAVVDKIKGAKGAEKKQAVIDSVDDFVAIAENTAGIDAFLG
jgi:hypothetical protein